MEIKVDSQHSCPFRSEESDECVVVCDCCEWNDDELPNWCPLHKDSIVVNKGETK